MDSAGLDGLRMAADIASHLALVMKALSFVAVLVALAEPGSWHL